MQLAEYFGDWLSCIDIKAMNSALQFIQKDAFYPAAQNVFKAFRECPFNKCKVVFLGQDPYPQNGVATGLAFANDINRATLSPSLEVLKEAAINYEIAHYGLKFDQTLCDWANQGILLLNSALTVKPNIPASHLLYWRPFIAEFLKRLSYKNPNTVFVLFGKQAQSFKDIIDNCCVVYEQEHPAALARKHEKLDYRLFYSINKHLTDLKLEPIKWFHDIDE